MPAEQVVGGEGLGSRAGDWAASCAALAALPRRPAGAPRSRRVVAWLQKLREYLENSFTTQEIGTNTLTGYYEPILRGNLTRSEPFTTPLLAMPPRDWARRAAFPPASAAVPLGATGGEAPQVAGEVWMAPPSHEPPSSEPPEIQAVFEAVEYAPFAQTARAEEAGALPNPPSGDAAHGTPPDAAVPATSAEQAASPRPSRATGAGGRARGRSPARTATAATLLAPSAPRIPYPSRTEIDQGALAPHALEIVWVDDPVEAFFLHIQGSGRVTLPDGGLLRMGYAGQNGHPYRAIGRILIDRAHVRREDMSMQAIRDWLNAAPAADAQALMQANASYIFFRVVEGLRPEEGPIGAMGVSLTPLRSVAVDPAFVPMGAPLFLSGVDPLPRLVVAQDTGGAIKGAGRADLFWGWEPPAGERAGRTYQQTRMFLLRPRPVF